MSRGLAAGCSPAGFPTVSSQRFIMKNAIFLLLGIVALNPAGLRAMPNPPHLANGVVQSVDLENLMLVIVPDDAGPRIFVIQVPRTRLRVDGKTAVLSQLRVGCPVRVYYKKEGGAFVATEISWKRSVPPPQPHGG